jgi:tRNA threonylcarbamoyladenosine biosynthesis protein TsaE
MTIETRSPEETMAAGRELAARLAAPALVMLIGDLGAGKTTFTKGIVEGLGVAPKEEVLSPTFSLIHEYDGDPKVYHIDLYRLDRVPELETLGLEDLWEQDAIVIIEWGEKFTQQLPGERIEIYLRYNDDDSRTIEILE